MSKYCFLKTFAIKLMCMLLQKNPLNRINYTFSFGCLISMKTGITRGNTIWTAFAFHV